MTTFEDREKAFEAKFARDEDLRFRSTARRNKLAGLWAAGLLGLSGDAAEEYARAVVKADFQQPGDADVVAKLAGDLAGKATPAEIEAKLLELMPAAVRQIEAGVK
jgi:hypothetical protein